MHLTGNVVAPTGGAVRRHMPFGEHARRMQQREERRAVLSQRRVDQEVEQLSREGAGEGCRSATAGDAATASTAETIPVTS